jgi:hypothetical protein
MVVWNMSEKRKKPNHIKCTHLSGEGPQNKQNLFPQETIFDLGK